MKVLLYMEGEKLFSKSGLGKAIKHQMKALESENIEYTTDTKDDYDIVHINYYGPASYTLAKTAHKKGKKVVYHAHSTEEDFKNGFIFSKQMAPTFKKWITKCYSLGDVIITPTPYSKRILEGYGINKKIYAISNGIELDKFKREEELYKSFRERYHYQKDDKIIMGIGLYIERKGIVDFVELAKRMPEYKFIWFGHSPLSAATKNVRDAVQTKLENLVFAGYVEPEIIVEAMNGCDIYITLEPCPMCASAIKQSRINNIYCGLSNLDTENIKIVNKILEKDKNNKSVKIYNNLTVDKIKLIMNNFFEKQRKK